MKAWLQNLQAREWLILVLAFVVLSGLGLHALFLEPQWQQQEYLEQELQQQQATLDWLREALPRLPQQGASNSGSPSSATAASLVSEIDRLNKRYAVHNQVQRLRPQGNARLRIWFEDVSYSNLMRWLEALDKAGIEAVQVRISSRDPGQVNANFDLQRGAAS